MNRKLFSASLSAALGALTLAACATTVSEPAITPIEPETTEVVAPDEASAVELAMGTVDELVAAGNTQTAIDRLTQLLGKADLTDAERAAVLNRRGTLRASASGFDLMGGIGDLGQVAGLVPGTDLATEASAALDIANGEATSLNFLLQQPETPRTQKFETLFRLGEHNDALDLMLSSGLKPDNEYLIAMYQIGYLCAGEDQTGPAYNAVEPDGTTRELRFCDFGK